MGFSQKEFDQIMNEVEFRAILWAQAEGADKDCAKSATRVLLQMDLVNTLTWGGAWWILHSLWLYHLKRTHVYRNCSSSTS
jgi:hypothetical protein